ncbi:MAG TPA: hypothetical protein VK821_01035 [Dehalococcoidia bacterium]|nr:hypothetical protein [Dehalococcoidia bacterium]
MNPPPPDDANEGVSLPQSPQHQVYFVTLEWHDTPHQPESPERVAHQIRQLIEHDHDHGPEMTPSRFTVRVKTEAGSAEVRGLATHRHVHQQAPLPPSTD